MDFPTVVTSPNQDPPDVVVTFSGLLMLRFHPRFGCRVGVLSTPGHLLDIGLELRDRSNGELIERWKYAGKLKSQFRITAVNPRIPGLSCYKGADKLDRKFPVKPEVATDFRWALNLKPFYEKALAVNPKAFTPAIQLNNGYFHTHKLFGKQKQPLYLERGKTFVDNEVFQNLGFEVPSNNNKLLKVYTVADVIGATIYLNTRGSEVKLEWGSTRVLFPKNSLTSLKKEFYQLTFSNMDETPKGSTIGDTSDLPLYYVDEGLLNIDAPEQLNLTQTQINSEDHPCIPIIP